MYMYYCHIPHSFRNPSNASAGRVLEGLGEGEEGVMAISTDRGGGEGSLDRGLLPRTQSRSSGEFLDSDRIASNGYHTPRVHVYVCVPVFIHTCTCICKY